LNKEFDFAFTKLYEISLDYVAYSQTRNFMIFDFTRCDNKSSVSLR